MDPTYPQSVTLFWLFYTPILLVAVAFFAWSLYRYVRSRWTSGELKMKAVIVPPGDVVPELIALQAQFIIAPKLARQEAVALLVQRRGGSIEAGPDAAPLPDDFVALLELLSRTRASVPTRPH